MSIGQAISNILSESSSQQSASLQAGFEGIAKGMEKRQLFQIQERQLEAERPLREAKLTIEQLAADKAMEARGREIAVQGVYQQAADEVTKAGGDASQVPIMAHKRFTSMGFHKEAKEALDAYQAQQASAIKASKDQIDAFAAGSDYMATTAAGIMTIKDPKQKEAAFKDMDRQSKEAFGKSITEQFPPGTSIDTMLDVTWKTSKVARDEATEMRKSAGTGLSSQAAQLLVAAEAYKDSNPEMYKGLMDLHRIAKTTADGVNYNAKQDDATRKQNYSKEQIAASEATLVGAGLIELDRKGKLVPGKDTHGMVTSLVQVQNAAQLSPEGAMNVLKRLGMFTEAKEGKWGFWNPDTPAAITFPTKDGKPVVIDKARVDASLIKNFGYTNDNVYQATPKQREDVLVQELGIATGKIKAPAQAKSGPTEDQLVESNLNKLYGTKPRTPEQVEEVRRLVRQRMAEQSK